MGRHSGSGDPMWWKAFRWLAAAIAVLAIMHALRLLPWQD